MLTSLTVSGSTNVTDTSDTSRANRTSDGASHEPVPPHPISTSSIESCAGSTSCAAFAKPASTMIEARLCFFVRKIFAFLFTIFRLIVVNLPAAIPERLRHLENPLRGDLPKITVASNSHPDLRTSQHSPDNCINAKAFLGLVIHPRKIRAHAVVRMTLNYRARVRRVRA